MLFTATAFNQSIIKGYVDKTFVQMGVLVHIKDSDPSRSKAVYVISIRMRIVSMQSVRAKESRSGSTRDRTYFHQDETSCTGYVRTW